MVLKYITYVISSLMEKDDSSAAIEFIVFYTDCHKIISRTYSLRRQLKIQDHFKPTATNTFEHPLHYQ